MRESVRECGRDAEAHLAGAGLCVGTGLASDHTNPTLPVASVPGARMYRQPGAGGEMLLSSSLD